MKKSNIESKNKNKYSVITPTCTDLGGCDCEGWLWFGGHHAVLRWCVLKSRILYLFIDNRVLEFEIKIHVLNSKICPIKESLRNINYFQIVSEDKSFTLRTEIKSDYLKWLNKLCLSASGVEITDKDWPIVGFSSNQNIISPSPFALIECFYVNETETKFQRKNEYQSVTHKCLKKYEIETETNFERENENTHVIVPTDKCLIYDSNGCKTIQLLEGYLNTMTCEIKNERITENKNLIGGVESNTLNIEGENENEDLNTLENSLNILHDFPISDDISLSENSLITNSNQKRIRPIPPPRSKASHINNLGKGKLSCTNNCSLDIVDDSKMNFKPNLSLKIIDPEYECRSINNENDEENIDLNNYFLEDKTSDDSTKVETNDIMVSTLDCNKKDVNASELRINAIKRVTELERLLREKTRMLRKIDEVLTVSFLPDKIQEFWDEHGEDISNIILER